MKNAVAIEHHPDDSRITWGGCIVQTLNERMGTGGNNVPLILEIDDEDTDREKVLRMARRRHIGNAQK